MISLAIIVGGGFLARFLFEKCQLPGLIGILILGILIGPHAFNLVDASFVELSHEFRMIAFIILLLRAGMKLERRTLWEVKGLAFPLGIIPAICETLVVTYFGMFFFHFSVVEAILLGIILSGVSPAVVIPSMLHLIESKKIPQQLPSLLITTLLIDDVFVLTLFGAFVVLLTTEGGSVMMQIASLPILIMAGIFVGVVMSYLIFFIMHRLNLHNVVLTIVTIFLSGLLVFSENYVRQWIPFSGIVAVVMLGFMINDRETDIADSISIHLRRIWVVAEIFLFVFLGMSFDPAIGFEAGYSGVLLIIAGLFIRSLVSFLIMFRSRYSDLEVKFCVASLTPKATLQAVLAGIPLAYGAEGGALILAIGILSILLTAPVGAILIKVIAKKIETSEITSAAIK